MDPGGLFDILYFITERLTRRKRPRAAPRRRGSVARRRVSIASSEPTAPAPAAVRSARRPSACLVLSLAALLAVIAWTTAAANVALAWAALGASATLVLAVAFRPATRLARRVRGDFGALERRNATWAVVGCAALSLVGAAFLVLMYIGLAGCVPGAGSRVGTRC